MTDANSKCKMMAFEHNDFGTLRIAEGTHGELGFCAEDVARALGMTVEEAVLLAGEENVSSMNAPTLNEGDIPAGGAWL